MRARFGGLWRHPDFRRLWAGQAGGSHLTALGAAPARLGLLVAAETAPSSCLASPPAADPAHARLAHVFAMRGVANRRAVGALLARLRPA